MTRPQQLILLLLMLVLPILLPGCGSDGGDDRYADLARESLKQQSRQNEAMARQSQEVAEATRQLIEADAKARRELGAMHEQLQKGLQSERLGIDQQRKEMEQERRDIAQQRHRDPLVAAAITQVALLLVAVVPLVFGIYLLRAVKNEDPDAVLGELLIGEFAAEEPLLIDTAWTRPPGLPQPDTTARLKQESCGPDSNTQN